MDPKNRLGLVVGHSGQGPGSGAAVYSFPGLRKPERSRSLFQMMTRNLTESSKATCKMS
jgi:hypothetical protein